MKRIYITDFDGTITQIDTNDAMADAFAPKEWREIDAKWHRGEISTQQATQQILSMVNATEEELDKFFRSLPLTPKFLEFVQWAEVQGHPIYIVSDGLDFNITCILHQHGIDHLPFYSNQLTFEENNRIITSPKERVEGCLYGTCKCSVLENIKRDHPDVQVVYIGDGYSDVCIAPKADILFAKGVLAEHCRKDGIEFYAFGDFGDVMKKLEGIEDYL